MAVLFKISCYIWIMFIRTIKKQRSKDAKVFVQYTLAQTS
ncbi:MAG: hypothetical protein ACJA01_001326, partial [Saprospiraceae bacterium]